MKTEEQPNRLLINNKFKWDERNETFETMAFRLLKFMAGRNPWWFEVVEGNVLSALIVEVDQLRRELGREPIVKMKPCKDTEHEFGSDGKCQKCGAHRPPYVPNCS